MLRQAQKAPLETLELLGDFHPLVEQLGSVDGLLSLNGASASLQIRHIESLPALREFLQNYHARILYPAGTARHSARVSARQPR